MIRQDKKTGSCRRAGVILAVLLASVASAREDVPPKKDDLPLTAAAAAARKNAIDNAKPQGQRRSLRMVQQQRTRGLDQVDIQSVPQNIEDLDETDLEIIGDLFTGGISGGGSNVQEMQEEESDDTEEDMVSEEGTELLESLMNGGLDGAQVAPAEGIIPPDDYDEEQVETSIIEAQEYIDPPPPQSIIAAPGTGNRLWPDNDWNEDDFCDDYLPLIKDREAYGNSIPNKWFDADGPKYDCEWYKSRKGACKWFGDDYENMGYTAKRACCTCGGGARLAIGRPYRDSEQKLLQAETMLTVGGVAAAVVDKADGSWSGGSGSASLPVASINVMAGASSCTPGSRDVDDIASMMPPSNATNDGRIISLAAEQPQEEGMSKVAKAWAQRGLGEHASVASFASFTLALMTNGAPPSLIRDSLNAALDEVRHAEASFRVANHLMMSGNTDVKVEPGPLPESTHEVRMDAASLALGAAKEGCVEETLSVFEALAEAQRYHDMVVLSSSSTDMRTQDAAMLRNELLQIATDEARHASLAWRTVRWVCRTDEGACQEVLQQGVLDSTYLDHAGRQRRNIPNDFLEEWTKLYQVLVPLVTTTTTTGGDVFEGHEGSDITAEEEKLMNSGEDPRSLLNGIVRSIIHGVACAQD